MLPVILDLAKMKVALVGGGELGLQRLKEFDAVGVVCLRAFADNFGKEFWDKAGDRLITRMPSDDELKNFDAVVIVDVPMDLAIAIAGKAKNAGLLVNVEDKKELSDFFYSSVLQRGDLIVTVNTTGKCHVLANRIKNIIGKIFHEGWKERVDALALKAATWEDIGLNKKEVSHMTDKYIDEKGWLNYEELAGKKEEV